MIRFSRGNDRSALLEIWKTCFGDSESYVNFFLDNGYTTENCLVWEENSSPVAMLHLRMADFIADGKTEPAMYIYAAATLPSFQKRGIMARLIDAAVNYADSQGCFFTFLLPAGDNLYNYYGKLGFKTAFEVKKARLNHAALEKAVKSHAGVTDAATGNGAGVYKRRLAFFHPAIQWCKSELDYAIAEWKFTGGEVLHFDNGYALCREQNGCVEIKETCGKFSALAGVLLSRYDCDTFLFLLPPYEEYPFETVKVRYGMLNSKNSLTADKVRTINAYANLMLD